jgi:hypothetical protein
MARSLQEQIDDNDAAIARAETAQSYTERGKSKQNALLAVLYRERARLSQLSSQPSSMCSLGIQVRPA